jgi:hypothetical protein
MFGRNVDFIAVLCITLVMLGLGWARSSHWADALDSVRVENAIRVESCPLPRGILTSLRCILQR